MKPRVLKTLRQAAMVAVAVASMTGAAAMSWVFVASQRVEQLTTAHLLLILGLVILPAATCAAWALDRKASHEPESRLEDNGLFELPRGVEVVEDPAPQAPPTIEREVPPRQVHQPHRRRRHGARAAGRRN